MWQITNNYTWQHIKEQFTWIQDMEGVPQDSIFHAEGDVETHTRMVMEAVLQLPEYQDLAEQDQHILIAAALLHDVEKRSTTMTDETGRIRSPRHAKKGEYTARRILYQDLPTPFVIKEAVAKLVRYHGLPLWIFDKRNPQAVLLKASLEVNTKLLYLLAKADVLGRICPDQADLLERVELFKEYCLEQHCFGVPYPFANDLARFHYFYKENSSPDYVPFDDTKLEVTLMCALPGSGKDTYIRNNLAAQPMISLDAIRKELKVGHRNQKDNSKVVFAAKERAKTYLREQQSFVWNATNISRQLRASLIDLFVTYQAKVTMVYLEVPYVTLLKQNRNRTEIVPLKVLNRMVRKLEIPSLCEAHRVIYEVHQ